MVKIKALRIEKGLTQEEFTKKLKMGRNRIVALEKDNNLDNFKFSDIKKIAEVLEIPFKTLITDDENIIENFNHDSKNSLQHKVGDLRKVKYKIYKSVFGEDGMFETVHEGYGNGFFHRYKTDVEKSDHQDCEVIYGLIETEDGTLKYYEIDDFKFTR